MDGMGQMRFDDEQDDGSDKEVGVRLDSGDAEKRSRSRRRVEPTGGPIIVDIPFHGDDATSTNSEIENEIGDEIAEGIKERILEKSKPDTKLSDRDKVRNGMRKDKPLLVNYPCVYIVRREAVEKDGKGTEKGRNKKEYTVYVGETTDIRRRTVEHVKEDTTSREDWNDFVASGGLRQYVIGHPLFNKSMTLDVENQLIGYMIFEPDVHSINRRGNPQGSYYPSDRFDEVFSSIWRQLHSLDEHLFLSETQIRDSALFKASPFHKLTDEQLDAERQIVGLILQTLGIGDDGLPLAQNVAKAPSDESGLAQAAGENATGDKPIGDSQPDSQTPKLILVQGAAGTGKTVLLSYILNELCGIPGFRAGLPHQSDSPAGGGSSVAGIGVDSSEKTASSSPDGVPTPHYVCFVVNHNEQRNLYDEIALRLRLQKKKGLAVFKSSTFINQTSEKAIKDDGNPDPSHGDPLRPNNKADVVFIDEAHLLLAQSGQSYKGKNQLLDILRRARVVVAVYDPAQILTDKQRWPGVDMTRLFADASMGDEASGSGVDTDGFTRVALPNPYAGLPVQAASDPSLVAPTFSVDVSRVVLHGQHRMQASEETLDWLDDFIDGKPIRPFVPEKGKDAYEIRLFDSPIALRKAIRGKTDRKTEEKSGISRLIATYDWPYKTGHANENDPDPDHKLWRVILRRDPEDPKHWIPQANLTAEEFQRIQNLNKSDQKDKDLEDLFEMPWNYQLSGKNNKNGLSWAENPVTVDEIGSTYTIQGFDLNYAGVILGPSISVDDNGRLLILPEKSCSQDATMDRSDLFGPDSKKAHAGDLRRMEVANLRNELNVLLKRGVHGLYLFAVDPKLQEVLRRNLPTESD